MSIYTELLLSKIFTDMPLARAQEIQAKARIYPGLTVSYEKYFHSRSEAIKSGLLHGQAWKSFIDSEHLQGEERKTPLAYHTELTGHIIHYELFMPSLELQASQEQKEKWLPLCESLQIIGCYAQTELGHGSNVRGVEIEASYDKKTQEFVFHSPSVTATKWWIGGLGVTATHALLVAKLIIDGQNYGPHAFFIQIRDLRTHEPLAGVDVGDIGAKMGMHANDNGFLRFNQFRQPKEVMLNRFARINESDEYEIIDANAIKILYLSLIRARVMLVYDAWYYLAVALNIGIKYSFTREQFPDPENPSVELKIINYQMQQYKLFRVLARLFVYIFAKPFIRELYTQAEMKLQQNDDSDLAFLHCIVSLYKAYFTYGTLEGIEEVRRSCGGHGFLMLSGLPSLYIEYLPSITFDGDNSILILQSARYIMSQLRKPGDMPGSLGYLKAQAGKVGGDPKSADFQQKCFEAAAHRRFQILLAKEKSVIAKGKKREVAWNEDLQVDAIAACEAVFYASVHGYFKKGISEMKDVRTRETMETLREIFASSELERFSREIIAAGVNAGGLEAIKEVQLQGFVKLRPEALNLIEAFSFTDENLNSVLARSSGKMYEEMIEVSKKMNPLNKVTVFPGIKEMLKPKL